MDKLTYDTMLKIQIANSTGDDEKNFRLHELEQREFYKELGMNDEQIEVFIAVKIRESRKHTAALADAFSRSASTKRKETITAIIND